MRKRRFVGIVKNLVILFSLPSIFAGVALDSWKALLFDQSEAGTTYTNEARLVATRMPAYVAIPEVPASNLYVIDVSDETRAIAKSFAIAGRIRGSVEYTIVYSSHREIPTTLIIEGGQQTFVAPIRNVSFAIEQEDASLAMR